MEVRFYYVTLDCEGIEGQREEITEQQVIDYWENKPINGKWYLVAEVTWETYCPECGRPTGCDGRQRIVDQEMIDRIRLTISNRKQFMNLFN